MLDVITIGGATRDIFLEIGELDKINQKDKTSLLTLPYGSKLVSKKTSYDYGGGAINVAVSLSRLGLKVASSCNIGKEGTGSLVVKYLKEEGVKNTYVVRDQQGHTGLSMFILGKDGEHAGFLERGANDNYRFHGFGALKKSRWFYVSSLTGKSDNSLSKIFNYAAKKGIKVAFNPGSTQLNQGLVYLRPFLAQTEMLILNLDEARELLKRTKTDLRKIEEILKALEECGPKITVVTAGKEGSWAIFEGKIYFQGAASTKVLDTTGAGDSFGSTFLFGVIKGFALPYCLKIASVNAASVVSSMGAGSGLLAYNRIKISKWL